MDGQTFVAALREQGVLADVDVGVPSGERDLGITQALAGLSSRRAKGREVLYPTERLAPIRSIGGRAHRILHSLSLDWPGGGRYVPTRTLPLVEARVAEVRAEFDAAVEDLAFSYATVSAAWLREWREEIEKAVVEGKVSVEEGTRIRQRLDKAEEPWSAFRARFYIELRLLPVPAPADLDDAFRALDTERQHGAELGEIRRRERERLSSEVAGFTESLVPALRTRAIEALEHLREVAERRDGRAHGKTLRVVREEFEAVRALNFVGDRELDALLRDFEARFLHDDVVEAAKTPEAFAGALGRAITGTVGALKRSLDDRTKEAVGALARRRVLA